MGCDLSTGAPFSECTFISIHAPIVGCDNAKLCIRHHIDGFQSTHPSWGATRSSQYIIQFTDISIHAPIVGCDEKAYTNFTIRYPFQSTHPSWGATLSSNFCRHVFNDFNPRTHRGVRPCRLISAVMYSMISIHAPIVGCDAPNATGALFLDYFNPRTYRGVRHYSYPLTVQLVLFQSTHPSWGATKIPSVERWNPTISIHAPIVGCDSAEDVTITPSYFISIHAPIVGCDSTIDYERRTYQYFNPRTHRGVRRDTCNSWSIT